jgi:methylamine dehydrogenase heavy chain
MRRWIAALAALSGLLILLPVASSISSASSAEATQPDERGAIATLPPVGHHWVWVADRLLAHNWLFDGDSGEVLGSIPGGATIAPKPPLYSAERSEFYSVEIDYARGLRGARTDYVTIYDAVTLDLKGEVILPTRTSESAASLAYSELLDGGRLLATFNQFPETSVSITDLDQRRFVGEIGVAGCAGIYPTGPLSFATLCGNGTMMSVELDETGRQLATSTSSAFFDVLDDPVMMRGGRSGDKWIFSSFHGMAHEVDFSNTPPSVSSWSLADEAERDDGWRPGGRQLLALHEGLQRLYVIFHQGGSGSHKDPGPEVWVFDLTERERVNRIQMPNFTAAFVGGSMGLESDGMAGWLLEALLDDRGADTITVSRDDKPLLFARSSELGAVAVLDARTGVHLRNFSEVGLAGARLEVP